MSRRAGGGGRQRAAAGGDRQRRPGVLSRSQSLTLLFYVRVLVVEYFTMRALGNCWPFVWLLMAMQWHPNDN